MYQNKKQLIERGWSLKLIRDFLGEPDDVKPLGRYCEEHRFLLPRIERIEKTDEFKTAQEKYLKRRNAGKQAAKTQSQLRIENAKTVIIRVRRLPEKEVLEEAIEHFNYRQNRRYFNNDNYWNITLAGTDSDSRFLERITVNYIRHNLTSYDSKLFAQRGRIGGDQAVPIIRRRVFEEIACAYPHLSEECDRQMIQRCLKSEEELKPKILYEQAYLPFTS